MAVRVFSHDNVSLVHSAKNLLATQGIEGQIRNEFHGGGGHVGLNIVPIELWVVDDQESERAKQLLKELASEDADQKSTWLCQRCGETNWASFDLCWNCQVERVSQ